MFISNNKQIKLLLIYNHSTEIINKNTYEMRITYTYKTEDDGIDLLIDSYMGIIIIRLENNIRI